MLISILHGLLQEKGKCLKISQKKKSPIRLKEPSFIYLTEQNDQLEVMQRKIDSLMLKIKNSKDLSEIKLFTSEFYQLFNELMQQYYIQKDKIVEGYKSYSTIEESIKKNLKILIKFSFSLSFSSISNILYL